MKILTNTQSFQAGGIRQAISSFLNYLNKNNRKDVEIIGIDIIRKYTPQKQLLSTRQKRGQITKITQEIFCRKIQDVLIDAVSTADLETAYQNVIDFYKKTIGDEKPDLIVINGTYFIPWCLYLAAKTYQIPIILHYHGIITKETESWDPHAHLLMKQMEQTFDNSRLQYIFPSSLAKEVVEKEVFGHPISGSAIIPNSIPEHFFNVSNKGKPQNVGMVGRWSEIKNLSFIKELEKYNQKNLNYLKINVVTDLSSQPKIKKGLSKKINLYNPMSTANLGKFYGSMGVVICPSFFETYGNVPQEAVACGTPALVGINMGVAEVFRRVGLANLIIDFSSVQNVYEKIREVSTQKIDPKIRNRMKKELSADKVNSELLNVYIATTS